MVAAVLAAASAGCAVSGTTTGACPIPGHVIHWIADYCMASLGTDDEIAASDCIDRQRRLEFENECLAKVHYKRSMCELAVRYDARRGSIAECVADPSFAGRTVREGGVGR